jgi:hypothetical protein
LGSTLTSALVLGVAYAARMIAELVPGSTRVPDCLSADP